MLKLYTGKPGSFKTAKAVSDAMKYLKEGRNVYTNIDSFDYEGVQKLPESLDWADCPHGSVIIYDEAQQFEFFQYKGREKLSKDPRVTGLETHRHQGYDIILITQSPSFLHNHVLSLVGEHYHLHRAYGRSFADVFLWRYTAHSPDSSGAKNKAESHEKFKPESKVFDNYKSTEIDTHKLKIPPIYFKLVGFLLLVICIIAYVVLGSDNTFLSASKIKDNIEVSTGKKESTTIQSDASSVTIQDNNSLNSQSQNIDYEKLKQEIHQQIINELHQKYLPQYTIEVANDDAVRPASIISYNGTCRAYNMYGDGLKLTQQQCKNLLANPHLIPKKRITESYPQNNEFKTNESYPQNEQRTENKSHIINEGSNNSSYFQTEKTELLGLTSYDR